MRCSLFRQCAIVVVGAYAGCADAQQPWCVAWSAVPNGPNGGPSARANHTLAWDSLRCRAVLFGGYGGGGYLGDTWERDGSGWRLRSTTGPTARRAHAAAYDRGRGELVLFGGLLPGGAGSLGDTWVWDGVQWAQRAVAGPPSRYYHAMAFDPESEAVVLFGGRADEAHLLDDTWIWNGHAWSSVPGSGPTQRAGHAMVEDPTRGSVVLFGGAATFGRLGDTWEWSSGSWALRTTAGPVPRSQFAMASNGRSAFVYGGWDANGVLLSDLWSWDGQFWTERTAPGPAPGIGQGMVFDTHAGKAVLFGGAGSGGFHGTTWHLSALVPLRHQPEQSAIFGGRATFFVECEGTPPISYRWRRNGQYLSDDGRIEGSGRAILTISGIVPGDAGQYDAEISGTCGTLYSVPASLAVDCYANCDGSTSAPVLNVTDFICFLNRYATGCP